MLKPLFLAALLLAAPAARAADGVLVIGTGGLAGAYDAVGGAVALIVDEGRAEHGQRLAVEPTFGAEENLRRLRDGDLDLAIVPADLAADARAGTGLFQDEGPFEGLRTLLTLYPETITVIARADSGIAGLADLGGKRVNLGPAGERTRGLAVQLLLAEGLALNAVTIAEYPPAEAVAALCGDLVDALVVVAAHPVGTVQRALDACPTVLVPASAEATAGLIAASPVFAPATIPGTLYRPDVPEVPGIGPMVALVARADLPAAAARAIVDTVRGRAAEFRLLYPALRGTTADTLLGPALGAPWHEALAPLLTPPAG